MKAGGHGQGNGGGGHGIRHVQVVASALTIAGATVRVASCVGVGSTGGSASIGVGEARKAGSAGMGVIGKPRFNNEEVGKDVALMITVVERKVPF